MKEEFEKTYQECITKLKNGHRPQVKLTPELIEVMSSLWATEALKKILCVLDNSQNSTSDFDSLIIASFEEAKLDSETLIYLLSVTQKQSIAHSFKSGHIINYKFFEIFKELLKTNEPELKEWTLRTIETLGPLSLRLKREVLAAKPGVFKLLNRHQQNCASIIDFMEKDWRRLERL